MNGTSSGKVAEATTIDGASNSGSNTYDIEDNATTCAKKSLGVLGELLTSPIRTILDGIITVLRMYLILI